MARHYLVLATIVLVAAPAAAETTHGDAAPESVPGPESAREPQAGQQLPPAGRFATVFAYGSSLGEPTNGKWITLASLYTLSATSLAFAGVEFVEYLQARHTTDDFLKRHDDAGPCFDLSSQACSRYSELIGAQNHSLTFATASLAGFGLFLLSGVVTAQVWGNRALEDARSNSSAQSARLLGGASGAGVSGAGASVVGVSFVTGSFAKGELDGASIGVVGVF